MRTLIFSIVCLFTIAIMTDKYLMFDLVMKDLSKINI